MTTRRLLPLLVGDGRGTYAVARKVWSPRAEHGMSMYVHDELKSLAHSPSWSGRADGSSHFSRVGGLASGTLRGQALVTRQAHVAREGSLSVDVNEVLVRVVPIAGDREIGWGARSAESLESRIEDVKSALRSGARSIAAGIDAITEPPQGWELSEVEGKFGVTLGAEGGVIVSKASIEASFEVTVVYRRKA